MGLGGGLPLDMWHARLTGVCFCPDVYEHPSTLRNLWQADQLAKCGAQEEQPSTSIHNQEKITIIKTALKPRKEKDAYHLLDRPGQVVLARLRSGHNRLNVQMYRY